MEAQKLYQAIATALDARAHCAKHGGKDHPWFDRWTERLEHIAKNVLPSGSGFDNGTRIDLDKSTAECIYFDTAFHHMDDSGHYCGWTEHVVRITPAFIGGINIKVFGRNRNDIKDYIAETFDCVLRQNYEFYAAELNQTEGKQL